MKLPPRITSERLGELLPLLRAGDLNAGKEIAEGHLRYANAMCRNHRNAHELTDIAFEAVWDAILKIKDGGLCHEEVTKFIGSYIRGRLSSHFRSLKILSPSRQTNDKRVKKGLEPYPTLTRQNFPLDAIPAREDIDALDEICKVADSDVEKQIIVLRSQDYSDKEIASLIGYSESWVYNTRKALSQRYTSYVTENLGRTVRRCLGKSS